MTQYFASVFVKSKYKTSKQKGIQATNYRVPYQTKIEARKAAIAEIKKDKLKNPHSKHLKYSAHVATRK